MALEPFQYHLQLALLFPALPSPCNMGVCINNPLKIKVLFSLHTNCLEYTIFCLRSYLGHSYYSELSKVPPQVIWYAQQMLWENNDERWGTDVGRLARRTFPKTTKGRKSPTGTWLCDVSAVGVVEGTAQSMSTRGQQWADSTF